jgi:hypothetical protein
MQVGGYAMVSSVAFASAAPWAMAVLKDFA